MSNWQEITIKKIVLEHRPVTYGIVQPGPDIRPNGIPLIRGRDYSSGKVNTSDLYNVKPEIDLPYKRSKVLPNDILFSIAGYVGQVAVVPASLTGANITQTTARISVDINFYNSEYVFYYLISEFTQIQVRKYAKGSAQEGLNLSDVEKIELKFPSVPEQRKIAKILSTTDTVIEKTQAAIAKYKAIKQGMLNDLFTRGIDIKTGKLRPKREDAPELYKESKLGLIPKEWDEEEFINCTELIKDGTHGTHKDVLNGVPLLSAKDIEGGNVLIPENCRRISPSDYSQIHANYEIVENDILLTIVGTIGRSAIVKNKNRQFTFQRSVGIIRTQNKKLLSDYFFQFTNTDNFQKQLLRSINASAQGGVYLGEISKMRICFSKNMEEQVEITKKLISIDKKIKTEQDYLLKILQIKSGLMADLLSGNKIVTV